MGLELVWLALLGLLLAGYFVLGGYDYGVQMLQPLAGRDDRGRRSMLGALGPFFLGNEVWLVAFGGVLFGAFPFLEGALLSGLYPLVGAILLGIVVGNTAVQLRSRARSAAGRRIWDALVVAGGLVPAVTWGLAVGVLLHGVRLDSGGSFTLTWSTLLSPFVLLCGVTTAALFAAHGATFLALRLRGELAERAAGVARPLLTTAVLAAAAGFVAAAASGVRETVTNPLLATLLAATLVLALVAARWALTQSRSGRAFAATCGAAALPVVVVGAGLYPFLLVSSAGRRFGMTVAEAAADETTLRLLTAFGVVLIPLILAYQFWSWWAFRGRVDAPTYF